MGITGRWPGRRKRGICGVSCILIRRKPEEMDGDDSKAGRPLKGPSQMHSYGETVSNSTSVIHFKFSQQNLL